MSRRTKAFRKAKRKVGWEEKRKMGQKFRAYGGGVSVRPLISCVDIFTLHSLHRQVVTLMTDPPLRSFFDNHG